VLGKRVDRAPSLVMATYREDEIEGDHPLRLVLGELASTGAVSRVSVPRLSFDAVRTSRSRREWTRLRSTRSRTATRSM
jgi:hypothetical protein